MSSLVTCHVWNWESSHKSGSVCMQQNTSNIFKQGSLYWCQDITSMLPQTHDIATINNMRCYTSRYPTSQDRQTKIQLSKNSSIPADWQTISKWFCLPHTLHVWPNAGHIHVLSPDPAPLWWWLPQPLHIIMYLSNPLMISTIWHKVDFNAE